MKRDIDDIEQYYYNNIKLKTGEQILNVNRSIRCETDFTKYVESLHKQQSKRFLWVRYTKTTHPIFERLLPILSNWNKFDKEQFMTKGTLLVTWNKIYPGYPAGKFQKKIFGHKSLDIVYE
jgi:hypothetical protein